MSTVADFQSRKATLDTAVSASNLQSLINALKTNVGAYIQTAGVNMATNQTTDAAYTAARSAWNAIHAKLAQYQPLNNDMLTKLKTETAAPDSQGRLTEIGGVQQSIAALRQSLEEVNTDLEVAKSRQESIAKAETSQSYQQGFAGRIGFQRPIHPASAAILIGLSFFMLCALALVLRDFFSSSAEIAAEYTDISDLYTYLNTANFKAISIGIAIMFAVFATGLYIYFYVF